MTALETILLGAIASLCGAIAFLFRSYTAEKDARRKDQADAAQLIFGLMSRVKAFKREPAPPTSSDWDDEPTTGITRARFAEAKGMAENELNGDVERLVRDFLQVTPGQRSARIRKGLQR